MDDGLCGKLNRSSHGAHSIPIDHSHSSNWAPPIPVSLSNPAEGARNRTLGSDCPTPSAIWAPHSPTRVHETAPSAGLLCSKHRLGVAFPAQGAQNCALGSGYRHLAPFSPPQPAPSVHRTVPSAAIALPQAPHGRRIPRRGCKILRPRPRLPPPCPFLITLTSAKGAQNRTFNSNYLRLGTT